MQVSDLLQWHELVGVGWEDLENPGAGESPRNAGVVGICSIPQHHSER